jgi:GT2 family glycosyltransferase
VGCGEEGREVISIVVVTYNRLAYTRECIASILAGCDVPAELIIVDNGSTDGTVEYLRELHPEGQVEQVLVTLNSDNEGCAVAYNQGFEAARGDPIWRIDNDVLVPPGFASVQLAAMDADPRLGMLTTDMEIDPRLRPEDVRIKSNSCVSYFQGPVWHNRGLGSWCMAHRRAMFEEVGYYRLDFGPQVMNDTDLQKRAENVGWRAGTMTGVVVGHLCSAREVEGELAYNLWKMKEQRDQVVAWERVWGKEP